MDSKLARKMAYKKKLEEEYREFQERCKYEKKNSMLGYEMRLLDAGQWSYQEISSSRRKDFFEDEEFVKQKQREEESRRKVEEEKKKKEEEYLRNKEKWKQKREECSKRVSRFAELKRKRSDEKRKEEEARRVLQSEDLWEELDLIICENANALKDLKEYQVSIETLVNEQKQRRNLSQQQPEYSLDRRSADTIRSRTRTTTEESSNEELDALYAKIKQLEHSIVSLDFELERYELDKMKEKTKMVKRRMSEAVGDGDAGTSSNPLDAQSVEMFIRNSNLWEKYKTS